jgi:hypothetical protein
LLAMMVSRKPQRHHSELAVIGSGFVAWIDAIPCEEERIGAQPVGEEFDGCIAVGSACDKHVGYRDVWPKFFEKPSDWASTKSNESSISIVDSSFDPKVTLTYL